MLKSKNGITLIVLVITIIVLLILAGVSINFMFGSEGIFTKAQTAVNKYKTASDEEQNMLSLFANYLNENYKIADSRTNDKCNHISSIIPDFEPQFDNLNGKSFTIKVPNSVISNAIGYVYIMNNEVKSFTTDTEYEATNLTLDTNYSCAILAIDNTGKIKYGTKAQKTLNKQYLVKDGKKLVNYSTAYVESTTDEFENSYIKVITSNTNNRQNIYYDNVDITGYSKVVVDMSAELVSETSGTLAADERCYGFCLDPVGINPTTYTGDDLAWQDVFVDSEGISTRREIVCNKTFDANSVMINIGTGSTGNTKKVWQWNIYNVWLE